MPVSEIADPKLRVKVRSLETYVNMVKLGQEAYRLRRMNDFRDDIDRLFEDYIKGRRGEAKKTAKRYKADLDNFYKFEERNIIATFNRQVQRAFGQAVFSIEKAQGRPLTTPGFLGLFALSRLVKKPMPTPAPVEGLSRLTKRGGRFSIDLIAYLVLLLKMAQLEWERRLNKFIAQELRVDLVRISPHPCWLGPRAQEVCNKYRDRILSLSGLTDGFSSLEEATSERPPLFHPNCTHKMFPLTKAEQAVALEKKPRTYTQLQQFI